MPNDRLQQTQDTRIKWKRSTIAGTVPTVAPSTSHLDGTWTATDLYIGEAFLNTNDYKAWLRFAGGIREIAIMPTGVQKGDLLYVNTSGTLSRLSSGLTGYHLVMNAGLPEWAADSGGGTYELSGDVTTPSTNIGDVANATIADGAVTTAKLRDDHVTTDKIADGAVTLAKQADMATASVVYRKTAGAGVPEVQTLATLKTDLGLTGTNSGDQTITLTSDVTGSGSGSFATTIANGAVTLAKCASTSFAAGTDALTGTTGANVSLIINTTCFYHRIGNYVTVTGTFNATLTAAANTASKMYLSLPIASNLNSSADLIGHGSCASSVMTCRIYADTTNDRAEIDFLATATGARIFEYTFSYTVG